MAQVNIKDCIVKLDDAHSGRVSGISLTHTGWQADAFNPFLDNAMSFKRSETVPAYIQRGETVAVVNICNICKRHTLSNIIDKSGNTICRDCNGKMCMQTSCFKLATTSTGNCSEHWGSDKSVKLKSILLKDLVCYNPKPYLRDQRLVDSIKMHGVMSPIQVKQINTNNYEVISGVRRYHAAVELGMHTIPCEEIMDIKHEALCQWNDCNGVRLRYNVGCAKHRGPIYVSAGEVTEFKKILARDPTLTIAQLAKQINIDPHFLAKAVGGVYTPPTLASALEKGVVNMARAIDKQILSKVFKKLCLEPGCRTKITIKNNEDSGRWFCKKHKLATSGNVRGFEDFPIVDRDGDTIWVQKGFNILKIKSMEDSHLTNSLVFLETASKKRCELTGLDPDKWIVKAGVRYPLLLAEAKRRDEKLKCDCKDGFVSEVSKTIKDEVEVDIAVLTFCTKCSRGEQRFNAKQLANEIAEQTKKDKKAMTVKMATMMIVALLAGGAYTGGAEFIGMVIHYLKDLNIVK